MRWIRRRFPTNTRQATARVSARRLHFQPSNRNCNRNPCSQVRANLLLFNLHYYSSMVVFNCTWLFLSSRPFPFPRPRYSICGGTPVCSSAVRWTRHRFWPTWSVLLQQQSNDTRWTPKCQRGFERLPWTIKWIQR